MEQEMETLEHDLKAVEESYGENMLNLTLARGYIKKLIDNAKSSFLNANHRTFFQSLKQSLPPRRCDGRQSNGVSLNCNPITAPVSIRRFDWLASCGYSETSQTNRLECTYTVSALNWRSETALHCAVVRSCHFRPAPFRFRFQTPVQCSIANVPYMRCSAESDLARFAPPLSNLNRVNPFNAPGILHHVFSIREAIQIVSIGAISGFFAWRNERQQETWQNLPVAMAAGPLRFGWLRDVAG